MFAGDGRWCKGTGAEPKACSCGPSPPPQILCQLRLDRGPSMSRTTRCSVKYRSREFSVSRVFNNVPCIQPIKVTSLGWSKFIEKPRGWCIIKP